jgi:hypothetical protein
MLRLEPLLLAVGEAPSATLACEFRDELQVREHRMMRCQEAQSVEVS